VLVARNGVIVLHEAFGNDPSGKPIGLDYRADVASITKSVTGILFSRFLDQKRVSLDEGLNQIFPDWPEDPSRVPSFRECFLHMAGLSGHGDWGGARNPQFENIVLNGIDANVAGKTYEYSGNGYELVGKAMEILAGKTLRHLYQDDLFGPLGLDDVPISHASMGATLTARELGTLGQWVVNRGRYGDRESISADTFAMLMPEPYAKRYPGVADEGGMGLHWKRFPLPGKPADTTDPAEQLFGPHTLGHGSLSMCVFLADLDNRLVIVQIRKTGGPKHGEYAPGALKIIADGLVRE
jgi:CubicO group peptidase (beta-lactamase class C family)